MSSLPSLSSKGYQTTTTCKDADQTQRTTDNDQSINHNQTFVVDTRKENFRNINNSKPKEHLVIHLSADEYEKIKPTGKYQRLRMPWTDIMYAKFHQHWPECSLKFMYNHCRRQWSRKSNSPFWAGRATCVVDKQKCITVTFTIADEPMPDQGVDVEMTVRGKCIHDTAASVAKLNPSKPNRRHLSREMRMGAATTVNKSAHTAKSFYLKQLAAMSDAECIAGNTTQCQTPKVISQAAYEYRVAKRLHNDLTIELNIARDCWSVSMPGTCGINGFIQGLGISPFYVLFYTEAQVKSYVDSIKSDNESVVNVDSTGSVSKSITGQKRPLYYCMFNAKCKLPACEFLTTRHNASWLTGLFEMFQEDAKKINGNRVVKPRFVVTDYSYALIYAMLYTFNKCTLIDYLIFCYSVLQRKLSYVEINSKTYITLCCAHVIKLMSRRFLKVEKRKRVRQASLVLFVLLMRAGDLQSAKHIYQDIKLLLTTEFDNGHVQQAYDRLYSIVKHSVPDKKDIRQTEENLNDSDEESDKNPYCDTKKSLTEKSPFSRYFNDVASDDSLVESDGCQKTENCMYSPNSFEQFKALIHAYPLWSAVLHVNPGRFGNDCCDSIPLTDLTCKSNAIIESHFKDVKHCKRNLGKQRPYNFVQGRLSANSARISEMKIKFPATRKGKNVKKDDADLASLPETWSRKKCIKTVYTNRKTAADILSKIRPKKRKRYTSDEQNLHERSYGKKAKLEEQDLQQTPDADRRNSEKQTSKKTSTFQKDKTPVDVHISKSNINANWIADVHNYDSFVAEPVQHSTPIASAELPEELNDDCVDMLTNLLSQNYPDLSGLQPVGLGLYSGSAQPRFAVSNGKPFVQVLNIGDHWICATNVFGTSDHDVFIYDSLQRKTLPTNAIVQISSLLRDSTHADRVTIHIRKFTRQRARSRDCGHYAVAAAFSCCRRIDPSGVFYDGDSLRAMLTDRFITGSVEPIAAKRRWPQEDIAVFTVDKLICRCHAKKGKGSVRCCLVCDNLYHVQCLPQEYQSEIFVGPCCAHITANENEVIQL